MPKLKTRDLIGIGLAVSAGIAWLVARWAAEGSPVREKASFEERDGAVGESMPSASSLPDDRKSPLVGVEAPPKGPPAARPAPNDSTYDWMTGLMRDAGFADLLVDAERAHAEFLRQSDDPAWARPAERGLRQFFESSASRSIQLTSVACSAVGCEVQAQLFDPSELERQLQPGVPHPTAEVHPIGPGLALKVHLRTPRQTPTLFYLWYAREANAP